MYELVFLSGARAGVVVPLAGTMAAGRDADAAVEVPDPRVSRQHAQFVWDGAQARLADTGSSNGTFLNEQPVTNANLAHGDIVRLGTTRLRVRHRDRRREPSGDRTAVFGFRDARAPQTSHTVSVAQLQEQTRSGDPAALQRRLLSMMRVAEMLARQRSLDQLHDRILDVLFDLLPQTDRGFLLLGDSTETLAPSAMRARGNRDATDLKVSRSICRAALEKRAALIYREGSDEPIDAGHSVVDLDIRSALAVPLVVGDDVVGMVVLDTRNADRSYTPDDLELAAAIGQQVAIAVRNAQLLEEVEAQTTTRNNLMRFLPEAMADQVLRGEVDAGLGGRRQHGTVLFSDLIGFTGLAERLGPEELVAFMNGYFDRLVPCVEHEGGSIDKFMGDAIMAVWGVPIDPGDGPRRAVAAALKMQIQLAAYRSEVAQPLPMGIGINTGDMVAGNIGAVNRMEFTVLGDTVNTAQRIGAAACIDQLLVSAATWDALGGAGFGLRMPPLNVKNRVEPVQSYCLRALRLEHDEVLLHVPVRYGDNKAYLVRRLADGSFILLHPADGPVSRLLIDAVEIEARDLGVPQDVSSLGPEAEDGALRRSVLRLADPSLGGLLDGSDPAPVCQQSWSQMSRGDTAMPG